MSEKQNIKILIAGVGNELRQDDAFGVLLARKIISEGSLPPSVTVMDFGIAGIHLVQELYNHYDILLLLDAVKWGDEPGTIYFREIEVRDINTLPLEERRDFLADMHYTNPTRALMLAKALSILPPQVIMLGCEASAHDDFAMGISEAVNQALPVAFQKVVKWLEEIQTHDLQFRGEK